MVSTCKISVMYKIQYVEWSSIYQNFDHLCLCVCCNLDAQQKTNNGIYETSFSVLLFIRKGTMWNFLKILCVKHLILLIDCFDCLLNNNINTILIFLVEYWCKIQNQKTCNRKCDQNPSMTNLTVSYSCLVMRRYKTTIYRKRSAIPY